MCAIATNKGAEIPEHKCYRNWSASSTSMESDIIAEGFSLSESMYGLRYMSVIGDGDSSVMANIRQAVSYGIFVTKIECANHACKAYRSRLETVAKDNPQFRGRGSLTKKVIQRLSVGARVAIAKHSKTGNVAQLRHDLRNGPSHVFGDHSQCSPEFCTYQPSSAIADDYDGDTSDEQPIPARSDVHSLPEQINAILDDLQAEQASQDEEQDAARGGLPSTISNLPHGLFNAVSRCCDRIVSLAPQLIANQTSNIAECYMSIRCLFDGGKYFNRVQRGSFQHRCNAAGLAIQHGPTWPTLFWQAATNTQAGSVLQQYTMSKARRQKEDRRRKDTEQYRVQRRSARHTTTASTDKNYGPDSQQDDLSPGELAQICREFYQREVVLSAERKDYVELNTRQQADDSLWHQQRRLRVTASNFGKVAKRRPTTPVGNLVRSLLYGKSFSTEATRWGSTHESNAKKQYLDHLRAEGHTDISIEDSGLFISEDDPCLACSPDGLVDIAGSSGVIEIKCPFKLVKMDCPLMKLQERKVHSSVNLEKT